MSYFASLTEIRDSILNFPHEFEYIETYHNKLTGLYSIGIYDKDRKELKVWGIPEQVMFMETSDTIRDMLLEIVAIESGLTYANS
jgi:hypothetical protein